MNDDDIRELLQQDVEPPAPGYWDRIDDRLNPRPVVDGQVRLDPRPVIEKQTGSDASAADPDPVRFLDPPSHLERSSDAPSWWSGGRVVIAAAAAVIVIVLGGLALNALRSSDGDDRVGLATEGVDRDDGESPISSEASPDATSSTSSQPGSPTLECASPGGSIPEIEFEPESTSGVVNGMVAGGESRWYQLEASATQRLTMQVEADAGVTATLIDPTGTVLIEPTIGGEAILPHSGDYRLCVHASDDSIESGVDADYQLGITITDVAPPEQGGDQTLSWSRVTESETVPNGAAGREITIERLVFSGESASAVAELNRALAELIAVERSAWLTQMDETYDPSSDRPDTLAVTSELTVWGEGLVAVRVDVFSTPANSAYPLWWSKALVFDVDTASVVTFDDMLIEGGRAVIEQLVTDAVIAAYEPDLGLLQFEALDDAAYAPRPDGLEVSTGRGAFLPPPYGGSVSILAWGDLDGVIAESIIARSMAGTGE